MNLQLIKKQFWAMRYMFISLGFLVWGITIDEWYTQQMIGMFGLMLFVSGLTVYAVES